MTVEVVGLVDGSRARIVRDQYPFAPELGAVVVRVPFRYPNRGEIRCGEGFLPGGEGRLLEAGFNFLPHPKSQRRYDIRTFAGMRRAWELYLKVFHGASHVEFVEFQDSDSAWYVVFDTPATRAPEWDAQQAARAVEGSAAAWMSYVNGDMCGIVREVKVSPCGSCGKPADEWEETNSVFGFFGANDAWFGVIDCFGAPVGPSQDVEFC